MEIYREEQRFDHKTGKPKGTEKVWKETRCDFSGKVVASSEREDYPAYYCKFILDYETQDPCMGSGGNEFEFGEKHKVEMFQFLNQPYVIYHDSATTGESEMPKFLKWAAKQETLDGALRDMRVATAEKLIAEGLVKGSELSED